LSNAAVASLEAPDPPQVSNIITPWSPFISFESLCPWDLSGKAEAFSKERVLYYFKRWRQPFIFIQKEWVNPEE
jgi:hypothetical protein